MQRDHQYVSAMQAAFANAVLAGGLPQRGTAAARVLRVADRQRVKQEPSVNVRVSFRTAQALKSKEIL